MKSLRATIAEQLKKNGVEAICSYGVRWEKGERIQINDVCYARAKWDIYLDGNMKGNKKGKIVELSASLEPVKFYSGEYGINITHIRKWVDYILNRSHFKECFKTRNIQAAWRYGVQMDVKKPVGQVIASLIALRECWEFKDIAKVFNLLTNNGINEDVSFLLSRMVSVGKDGRYEQKGFGGHQAIGSGKSGLLKAFIKHGLDKIGEPLENNPTWYKVHQSTRTDPYLNDDVGGAHVSDMLFKGGKKTFAWGSPSVTKAQLITNAKKIEKELLS